MCTIFVEWAFSNRVHVLMEDPPHMAALAPKDPFDPEALCLRVDLGVEALDHLMGGEQAEVSPLGGVGAEGVVQADLVKEHHVAHAGIRPRVGEVIARRRDEKDIGAFFVEGELHANAGPVLDIVRHEFEHVLDAAGLDAEVVSRSETVRYRFHDPVDVAADEIQELPSHHRDLRLVDPVRAKDGAPPALRALVEVVEPLLEDVDRQVAGAREFAEALSRSGEIAPVDGTQEFRPEDRHVLRIAGADVEVALVRAGAAPDAEIHEKAERPVFIQALAQPLQDDRLPVRRELPVLVGGLPGPRVREAQGGQALSSAAVAPGSRPEDSGGLHPRRLRRCVTDRDQFVGFGRLGRGHRYSFSTGSPASFIFSRNSSSYSS
jgi:hypothetical protein